MKHFSICLLVLALAACSGSGEITSTEDAAPDIAREDAGGQTDVPVPTDAGLDDMVREEGLVFPDLPDPDIAPACTPGTGCFSDGCQENGDCQSGWCVQHMGERVCTQLCQEDCPAGWSCNQIAGTAPDAIFICVSDFANLCRPCSDGSDCTSAGGAQDACIDYGAQGAFCGGQCTPGGNCPWGFSCKDVLTVNGAALTQCVADAGVCPCTDTSVALGLATNCAVENEYGLCAGQRVCTADGLTDCNAAIPALEECNGSDDDCNGQVDEPNLVEGDFVNLCDDGNDCTDDKCNGAQGCANIVLETGSCDDADPCSVADHCETGICVGTAVECDDDNPCTDDGCTATGGCQFEPNFDACDDGDPCTVGDQCGDGECSGTAVSCECQNDTDCSALDDGNMCNGVLFCNVDKIPYQCDIVPGSQVSCPEPEGAGSQCLKAWCDPETGQCGAQPAHEGLPCDDGDKCTVGEVCANGLCDGGVAPNCSDSNTCTEDFCQPQSGCTHVNNSLTCQDGDACTVGDMCVDGMCVPGIGKSCNDANSCTYDECDPVAGCLHEFATGTCDDGNPCTENDKCVNGTCTGASVVDCDDGNPCTKDICLANGGCSNIPVPGPCDDGDACTIGDFCQNGNCMNGPEKPCEDNNQCTADACVNGACIYTPVAAGCTDGNECTTGDACINGQCTPSGGKNCDDDNPCTTEYCDPESGCVYTLNTAPCDDGNPCTTKDACAGGMCKGGEALDCDDANVCTLDNCSPDLGCTHSPWDGNCNDQNPCTEVDTCVGGVCVGQKVVQCNDQNPCTLDVCNPASGECDHVPAFGFCTDNDECTINDWCDNGECQAGLPLNCNDGNLCTDDACDSDDGCVYQFNNKPCDDQNLCTVGDQCGMGLCQAGPNQLNCDDENVCTDDSCLPASGCLNTANDQPCEDGNVCTENDTCAGKQCQPGAPVVCQQDADPCTQHVCQPAQGCVEVVATPCCGNGIIEAGEECDDGNKTPDDGCDSDCQKESDCVDQGNDKLIYVSELNACLQTLGAQFSAVQFIEVAYGNTGYLDNICKAMGYDSYNGCHGGDQCSSAANMYPSHCGQGWLGGPCWNGCGNVNYDGFFCK